MKHCERPAEETSDYGGGGCRASRRRVADAQAELEERNEETRKEEES